MTVSYLLHFFQLWLRSLVASETIQNALIDFSYMMLLFQHEALIKCSKSHNPLKEVTADISLKSTFLLCSKSRYMRCKIQQRGRKNSNIRANSSLNADFTF